MCWMVLKVLNFVAYMNLWSNSSDVLMWYIQLTLRMRMKLVSKPACRWGGWICTALIWSPKRRLLDTTYDGEHVTKNRLEIILRLSRICLKEKLCWKMFRKMPCFFYMFFFWGGGLGRCVTWDGFMLFYWSFAHVRQRPRVVQAARRLGEIPGNWDLFRWYYVFYVAGRVQMFRDIWWCYLDVQFSTLMSILDAYYHYVIIKGKRDQLGIGRFAFKPLFEDPRLFFFRDQIMGCEKESQVWHMFQGKKTHIFA